MTNFLLVLFLVGGFIAVVGLIALGYACWRASIECTRGDDD